ncbi:DNA cytosine methyltransferase [Mesorhizobium atlanticum]|uniref:DNA (cytosine-5-)-methyltransferase n=1 Tax=Mesorhizobium atlanticum TaxID=2233532 RepID=A0A330GUQ8_9HYPH|nr:DNA cytosine methyltransferase [Mesorhizobium atlanticum]RAZ78247.1 DNA cytosine methyltransferase [Mesorhizobium atlanticum]
MTKRQSVENGPPIVQVIDLFSGCGGMSLGFLMDRNEHISYRLLGGLDIDPHAAATYRKMLGRPCLELDIRRLSSPSVLSQALSEWGYDAKLPLILIGCAPCQGFSSHRKKDRRKDDRNNLLSSFADIVEILKPDLVVMENVPEMLYLEHWKHFSELKEALGAFGYAMRTRVENLATFGVPQERYRALVMASRDTKRVKMPLPFVQPDRFLTVRDAIEKLPPLRAGERDQTDPMHITSKHRPETLNILRLIPKDGGSRRSLPPGVGPECHTRVDGFRDVYGRLWWDRPAVAITARCRTPSCGRFVHPSQDRGLTVREAALLQGFPEDFMFEGPFDDKFKQIGNAVSPIFSRALAKHIGSVWFGGGVGASEREDVTEPITKSISSSLASMKRKLRHNSAVPGLAA